MKNIMTKKWWQFWKSDRIQNQDRNKDFNEPNAGEIKICGYTVSHGSKLYQSALMDVGLGPDETPEANLFLNIPEFDNTINQLMSEWAKLGYGVVTDKQRKSMARREKEIGHILNNLGGIDLMRSFAYKLINSNLSYESDFNNWHGIGDWQN